MGGYDKAGPIDDASAWACDCIVSLSIVSVSDYPYKPDSKDLAQAIHTRDLEIDQLRARVAELTKDAERYRWLKDEDNWGCDNPSGDSSESRWGDLGELHGDAFDEFVDAQMAQSGVTN